MFGRVILAIGFSTLLLFAVSVESVQSRGHQNQRARADQQNLRSDLSSFEKANPPETPESDTKPGEAVKGQPKKQDLEKTCTQESNLRNCCGPAHLKALVGMESLPDFECAWDVHRRRCTGRPESNYPQLAPDLCPKVFSCFTNKEKVKCDEHRECNWTTIEALKELGASESELASGGPQGAQGACLLKVTAPGDQMVETTRDLRSLVDVFEGLQGTTPTAQDQPKSPSDEQFKSSGAFDYSGGRMVPGLEAIGSGFNILEGDITTPILEFCPHNGKGSHKYITVDSDGTRFSVPPGIQCSSISDSAGSSDDLHIFETAVDLATYFSEKVGLNGQGGFVMNSEVMDMQTLASIRASYVTSEQEYRIYSLGVADNIGSPRKTRARPGLDLQNLTVSKESIEKSDVWQYAMKMRYASIYHDCSRSGEVTWLANGFSDFVLDRLPDCTIEFGHVATDMDFKEYEDTYFKILPEDILPKDKPVPFCNSDDMIILFEFLERFGSHYVKSGVTGGEIKTMYEISAKEINTQLTEHGYRAKIKQAIAEHQFNTPVKDVPTRIIKFTGADNSNGQNSANKQVPEMVRDGNRSVFEDATTLETSANDLSAAILNVATEVTGGVFVMPLSPDGAYSPQDKERWVKTLTKRPGLISKTVASIEELLQHPTMIRSLMMYCGPKPFGPYGSELPGSWNPLTGEAKPDVKWQNPGEGNGQDNWNFIEAIAADLSQPEFSHVWKWDDLKKYECGKMLLRKSDLIVNFRRFIEVKADVLIAGIAKAESARAESNAQFLLMEDSFFRWVAIQKSLAQKKAKAPVVSTKRLWEHISDLKDSEPQGSLANIAVEPLMHYLFAKNRHAKQCLVACNHELEGRRRKMFLNAILDPNMEEAHGPISIIQKNEIRKTFDNVVVDIKGAPPFAGAKAVRFKQQQTGAPGAPGAPGAVKAKGEEGEADKRPYPPLESEPTFVQTALAHEEKACAQSCHSSAIRLYESGMGIHGPAGFYSKEAFMAAQDQMTKLCKGMLQAEFDPSSKLLADQKAGQPADLYCAQLTVSFEKDMCFSLKEFMQDRLRDDAGLPRRTTLGQHRLSYLVTSVILNNANYMRYGNPRSSIEQMPYVITDGIPEAAKQNGGLARTDNSKKMSANPSPGQRQMGDAPKTDEKAGPLSRGAWTNPAIAQGVCDTLVPGKRMDSPALREAKDTHDIFKIRETLNQDFRKIQQQMHASVNSRASKDKGTLAQEESKNAENEDNVLRNKLWCTDLFMKQTLVAEERLNAEERFGNTQCFACKALFTAAMQDEDICKYYPEKAPTPAAPAAGGGGGGPSAAGGGGGGGQNPQKQKLDRRLRFAEAKSQPKNEWGFTTSEKVICAGSTVDPKKAIEEVLKKMKDAIAAPLISKLSCEQALKSLTQRAVNKRDILAGALGIDIESLAKCDAEGKDKTACAAALSEFKSNRDLAIDHDGNVGAKYLRDISFRHYGHIGMTPCQDLGYCTEAAETSILKWLKAELKRKAASNGDPDKTFPPGFMDPKDTSDRQKNYKFPMNTGNPAFAAAAAMAKK